MLMIWILLVLATLTEVNFTPTPIRGNIYVEEISKVHLFHEKWKLIFGINLTSTEERVKTINKTMNLIKLACNKNCTPQFEIQLIKLRYNRLVAKEKLLQKLLGKQPAKRGLANFVGDISRTCVKPSPKNKERELASKIS